MKRLALSLLLGLLVLSGCASQYVIKLTNGNEITTASKPKLNGGTYSFKDAKGQEHFVPVGRVYEIEPASLAKQERKAKPAQPKHKHRWYFLWLA
jgi:hypothetical protein